MSISKFSALDLLNRAAEYGIAIMLDGDDLEAEVEDGIVAPDRIDRALAVLKKHRQEIIAYLRSLQGPALCSVCFEPAMGEPDDQGLMYCAAHHPTRQAAQPAIDPLSHPVVNALLGAFGPCEIEVVSCRHDEYIARRKKELEEEARQRSQRYRLGSRGA